MSRTAGGVTTAYQYDGDQVLLEKQESTTAAAYTYGSALLREGGATPLFDGLGSARTLTDGGGSATAGAVTTAFGQPVSGGVGAYGFGATSGYRGDGDGSSYIIDSGGNEYSDGDGLIKVGCRYYDPATGSFLTRDTDLGQSPYAYCDEDPVNAVDPDGHNWIQNTFMTILAAARMFVGIEKNDPELPEVPIQPPAVVTIYVPKPPSGGPSIPGGGSGGGVGGIVTVATGLGVGAQAANEGLHWQRAIAAYEGDDPNQDPPDTGGGGW